MRVGIAIAFLFCSFLLAQTTANKGASLDELLNLLQQNREIKQAEFEEEIAQFKQKEAQAKNFGSLDLQIQMIRSNDPLTVFGMKATGRSIELADMSIDNLNYPSVRSAYNSKLVYSLPIYTGNKISTYEKIAKKLSKLAALDKKALIVEKKYELKKSYYSIVLLDNLIEQMKTILQNTKILKQSTKKLLEEGYATKTDLLQVEARLEEINALLSQLDTNRQLAYHFLRFLTASNVSKIEHPKAKVDFKDYANDEILSKNLMLQKAKVGVDITKDKINLSTSEYLPQIGLIAEYGSSDEKFLNNFKEHDYYTFGLGFKLNLFSGGATKYAHESAKIDYAKQKLSLAHAKEAIVLQAEQIRTNIKNYNAKLRSLYKESLYKKEIFENYKKSYTQHYGSMIDILIHQSKYIESLMNIEEVENKKYEEIFKFEKLIDGGQL